MMTPYSHVFFLLFRTANMFVLSLMVSLDPIQWTTYTQVVDVFGRTSESFSQCAWLDQWPYLLTLGTINFLALCLLEM
jgi:hypothetical protein